MPRGRGEAFSNIEGVRSENDPDGSGPKGKRKGVNAKPGHFNDIHCIHSRRKLADKKVRLILNAMLTTPFLC